MSSGESKRENGISELDDERSRVRPVFSWINGHIGLLSILLIVAGFALGIGGTLIADTDEPNFSPSGEIYDTEARAEEVFASSSPIRTATFLVDESTGQDVLTQAALFEFFTNSAAVRADGEARMKRQKQGAHPRIRRRAPCAKSSMNVARAS